MLSINLVSLGCLLREPPEVFPACPVWPPPLWPEFPAPVLPLPALLPSPVGLAFGLPSKDRVVSGTGGGESSVPEASPVGVANAADDRSSGLLPETSPVGVANGADEKASGDVSKPVALGNAVPAPVGPPMLPAPAGMVITAMFSTRQSLLYSVVIFWITAGEMVVPTRQLTHVCAWVSTASVQRQDRLWPQF